MVTHALELAELIVEICIIISLFSLRTYYIRAVHLSNRGSESEGTPLISEMTPQQSFVRLMEEKREMEKVTNTLRKKCCGGCCTIKDMKTHNASKWLKHQYFSLILFTIIKPLVIIALYAF